MLSAYSSSLTSNHVIQKNYLQIYSIKQTTTFIMKTFDFILSTGSNFLKSTEFWNSDGVRE